LPFPSSPLRWQTAKSQSIKLVFGCWIVPVVVKFCAAADPRIDDGLFVYGVVTSDEEEATSRGGGGGGGGLPRTFVLLIIVQDRLFDFQMS
jgi:hypothetical protein